MLRWKHVLALTLLAAFGPGPLFGQGSPPPRFTLIFAERSRFETWDNAISLDDDVPDGFGYTRNKTTLGLRWLPRPGLEVTGKLTNEFRVYFAPKDRPFNWSEAVFDNLFVRWRIPGRLPVTLSAGRMDLFLGEGFVIADGTPLDGSRTFYFNVVRADWEIRPKHDLMVFAHAQDRTDRFLPVIHSQEQPLVEQPERALAVYYSGEYRKVKVDGYIIRKFINAPDPETVRSRFNTYGARVQALPAAPLSVTAEAAVQTGSYGDFRRFAFGGLAHVDYLPALEIPCLKGLVLGGIFLSGDRPETDRMEGWDPLFSRWPKWSEGYIYTFIRESRVAYWSNITSLYGSLLVDLGSKAGGILTLHRLGAVHAQPGPFPGGTGLRRGTLLVGRLNCVLSRRVSGHIEWDHFEPGDFYFPGAAGFNWLRVEVLLKH